MSFESYYAKCPTGMSNWLRMVAADIDYNNPRDWIHINIPRYGSPCPSYSVNVGTYENMANDIFVAQKITNVEEYLARLGDSQAKAAIEAERVSLVSEQEQLEAKNAFLISTSTRWVSQEAYNKAFESTADDVAAYNAGLNAWLAGQEASKDNSVPIASTGIADDPVEEKPKSIWESIAENAALTAVIMVLTLITLIYALVPKRS